MTNTSQEESSSLPQVDDVGANSTFSIFTSAQYAKIVKMFGAYKVQYSSEAAVNMVGTAAALYHSSFWIIDSGANEHMVGDYKLLQRSQSMVSSPTSVRLPNGSKALVHRIGSVVLTESITLDHVLHIPDFRFNLLSISKFTKDHNCLNTLYPQI